MIIQIDWTQLVKDSFILILGIFLALFFDVLLIVIKGLQEELISQKKTIRSEINKLFNDLITIKKIVQVFITKPNVSKINELRLNYFDKNIEIQSLYYSYLIHFEENINYKTHMSNYRANYRESIDNQILSSAEKTEITDYNTKYVKYQSNELSSAVIELLNVIVKKLFILSNGKKSKKVHLKEINIFKKKIDNSSKKTT